MLDHRRNILLWSMPPLKLILCAFLLHSSSSGVLSDILNDDVANDKAWCDSVCQKFYPLDFSLLMSTTRFRDLECCRRGCRYYSVASSHVAGLGKDKTDGVKKVCERSCTQAYSYKRQRMICMGSCSRGNHNDKVESRMSWAVYVEDGNSVLVIQPAADFEPDDVLTDPGLRSQLTNAAGDRLPETHIRSIPDLGDELLDMEMSNVNARSVLDCLSRRVGLSKLSLLFLLMLVLVVAILAFASSLTDKQARQARLKNQDVSPMQPLLEDDDDDELPTKCEHAMPPIHPLMALGYELQLLPKSELARLSSKQPLLDDDDLPAKSELAGLSPMHPHLPLDDLDLPPKYETCVEHA